MTRTTNKDSKILKAFKSTKVNEYKQCKKCLSTTKLCNCNYGFDIFYLKQILVDEKGDLVTWRA